MVEGEMLRRRIGVLLDALADLRRYRDRYDATSLASDRDAQHMVLHALYVAAQAAIDIALHAGASGELPAALTYQDSFQRLADSRKLPVELARKLMGWAGLRNVLAHQYATIDFTRVAATLAGELGDLEEFARLASSWT